MRLTDPEVRSTMPGSDEEALQRLAENIHDGTALFAIYNKHQKSIEGILRHYLGEEGRSKKALDAIVDRIVLRARYYDAQLEMAEDWILQEVTEEARFLQKRRAQGKEVGNALTIDVPCSGSDAR